MSNTLTIERMQEREEAITLHKMGWAQQRIAKMIGVPQQTISYWLSREFKLKGLALTYAVELRQWGLETEKIAEMMGISPSIIERWVSRIEVDPWKALLYQQYGMNGDNTGSATLANIGRTYKFTNNGKRVIPIIANNSKQ